MPDRLEKRVYSEELSDRQTDSLPLLGLFVHPQNERGKRFFRSAGFRPFHQTSWDEETQTMYEGMILDLPRGQPS